MTTRIVRRGLPAPASLAAAVMIATPAPRKGKLSDLQRSLLLLQQIQGTPGRAGGARPDPQSP